MKTESKYAEFINSMAITPFLERLRGLVGGVQQAKDSALEYVESAKAKGIKAWTADAVRDVTGTADMARAKVVEATKKHGSLVATAAGAAGAAVALGSASGAAGMTAGSALGAAAGVVPALFTFGLSIPIGAAVGGSAGLWIGAAVGSAAGAVGGGAAGYGVYAKHPEIREGASQAYTKVTDYADFVKDKAKQSTAYLHDKAAIVRTRLLGSGTGGTETSD